MSFLRPGVIKQPKSIYVSIGVVPESSTDETQVPEEKRERDEDMKKQAACQPTEANGAADNEDTTGAGKIERQIQRNKQCHKKATI